MSMPLMAVIVLDAAEEVADIVPAIPAMLFVLVIPTVDR